MEKTQTITRKDIKSINPLFQQIEVEQQGFCNLNCTYCFYPKDNKLMQKMNKDIVDQILNDKFITWQKEVFQGREHELDGISLFGPEPTLNTYQYIKQNFFEKFIQHFPRLKQFSISTNLINNQNKLKQIVLNLQELSQRYKRPLTLDLQLSIDGSEEINEKNRGKGMHEKIYNTYKKFINMIQEDDEFRKHLLNSELSIQMHFKPTYDVIDIFNFYKDISFFEKQIQFYNHLCQIYSEQVKEQQQREGQDKQQINILQKFSLNNVYGVTLQLSGNYTKESGLQLYYLSKWLKDNINTLREKYKFVRIEVPFYIYRFKNFLKHIWSHQVQRQENFNEVFKEGIHNYRLDGCSQQKTCLVFQQDGSLLLCNVQHFLDNEQYRKMYFNRVYSDVHDMRNREILLPQFIQPIISENKGTFNKIDVVRYLYQNASTYYQFRFEQSMIKAIVLQLQSRGKIQDSLLLKDETYLDLFQNFLHNQYQCVQQYRLETGSGFIPPVSIINIFAHGLFRLLVQTQIEEKQFQK